MEVRGREALVAMLELRALMFLNAYSSTLRICVKFYGFIIGKVNHLLNLCKRISPIQDRNEALIRVRCLSAVTDFIANSVRFSEFHVLFDQGLI